MDSATSFAEDLHVLDAGGRKLLVGTNNKRTKLFNAAGEQITKSCHVCQDQHVKFKCRASASCSYSFCQNCLAKYHETLSLADAVNVCPVCRGVCSCRACLRKTFKPQLVLEQNPNDNAKYAEEILRNCGPCIATILGRYDEEATRLGVRLADVEVHRDSGAFITCDRCSTSIADFHLRCDRCGDTDICVDCVAESRLAGRRALETILRCGKCEAKLVPARMLSKQMLKALREIADIYGEVADRPVMPRMTDDRASWVEVCFSYGGGNQRVELSLTVKEPESLADQVKRLTEPSEKQKSIWEAELSHLDSKFELRDAGFGQSVRCIAAGDCTAGDLHLLLRLSAWTGQPFIVTDVKGAMDWRPQTMSRALADRRGQGKKRARGRRQESDDSSDENAANPDEVCVIHCLPKPTTTLCKQSVFFNLYEKGDEEQMCKIKDWPQDASFQEKLTRHYQDFVEMLPYPVYANPVSGQLNMTRALPEYRCPPDVGPKSYLATGRQAEKNDGTDSVTKIHLDMTDAVNILVHAQSKSPGDSNRCGAVWTVAARKDVATITEYFADPNAICEKNRYMTARDRERMVQERGAQLWTFEQFENEAVYVPSGCPHQVRNTRSCLKVAVDFFPPESAAIVMELTNYRRQFAQRVRNDEASDVKDTLQGAATIMYASLEAYRVRQDGINFQNVDAKHPRKYRKIEEGFVPERQFMKLD